MNDEFLNRAAPNVRVQFAEALYERLARAEPKRLGSLGWIGLNRRTLKYSLTLMLLTAIAVACAREVFKPRYVQVGDLWVLEVAQEKVRKISFLAIPSETAQPVLSLPPEPIPIVKALEMLPYHLALPSWLPEGYSLISNEVRPPLHPDWSFTISWENEEADRLAFWSSKEFEGEIRAAAGTWEQRTVLGRSAILIRGRFLGFPDQSQIGKPMELLIPTPGGSETTVEIEFRWEDKAGLGLIWSQGGGRFHLQTYGDYLSEPDLIRIAESMGPP